MLASEIIKKHRKRNQLHTIVLFAGMFGLVILLGFLLAGQMGLITAAVLGVGLVLLAPKVSPQLVLRMHRAQVIDIHDAPNLYQIMSQLATKAELEKVPQLHLIPGNAMNAFAVGTPDNAHVAITEGLLKILNLREITGVLAHEISHVSNNDMRVMGLGDLISRLTRLLSNIGKVLLIINLPLVLVGAVTIPWVAIGLLIFAPGWAGLLQLALSRTREFHADLHAAMLTDDPTGLANALCKIESYTGNFFQQIFRTNYKASELDMFRSHPPTSKRIARLNEMKYPEEPRQHQLNKQETLQFILEKYRQKVIPWMLYEKL